MIYLYKRILAWILKYEIKKEYAAHGSYVNRIIKVINPEPIEESPIVQKDQN